MAVKRGYPTRGAFPGWGEVLRAFLGALPGLLIVVIILAGILSGVFTATESAADRGAVGAAGHRCSSTAR